MASRRAKRNALSRAIDRQQVPAVFYKAKWGIGAKWSVEAYDPLGDVLKMKEEAAREWDEWVASMTARQKFHAELLQHQLAKVKPPPAE